MSDWFAGNGHGGSVDATALVSDASDALGALVQLGALVSVGITSDGGALGVTVTLDGRWRREYFRGTEDMLAWLAEAIEAVKSSPVQVDAPPVRRTRSRGTRGA